MGDWATNAANEIMSNLDDRRGVLDGVDDDIREEIRGAIAEIIRKNHKENADA